MLRLLALLTLVANAGHSVPAAKFLDFVMHEHQLHGAPVDTTSVERVIREEVQSHVADKLPLPLSPISAGPRAKRKSGCLLYTSDAADE